MDVDLENGNGGGGGGGNNNAVAVLRCADRADPHMKERQPLTWLRAAPYVGATLIAAGLFAAFLVLGDRSCTVDDGKIIISTAVCGWAVALGVIGAMILGFTVVLALAAAETEYYECCCVPRLEADR